MEIPVPSVCESSMDWIFSVILGGQNPFHSIIFISYFGATAAAMVRVVLTAA